MIELYNELYIGSDSDVDSFLEQHPDGCIIHAAKEPWHRTALGYKGRGAPKGHPDYLFKKTDTRLYLNLVDSDNVDYIPEEVIEEAIRTALTWHRAGLPILIHCNQGMSRSVLIGLCLEPWLGMPINELLLPAGAGCAEYYAQNLERYFDLADGGEDL